MFKDLSDASLKPEIDYTAIPEIHLSLGMRTQLQEMFKREIKGNSFIRVDYSTTVVQRQNQYVFFTNQWYYLATQCKEYAQAAYEYWKFFVENIKDNDRIIDALVNGKYDDPEYIELFNNEEDRERMTKFISKSDGFRDGRNTFGEDKKPRSDIFESCVLKILKVPDSSSSYLGNIILLLVKNPTLYNDLAVELDAYLNDNKPHYKPVIPATGGVNRIFYGAPGCGKSHRVDNKLAGKKHIRVTFHPEYSNVDFIGQILPTIEKDDKGEDKVKYVFHPGAFTLALLMAYNTTDMVYLIVEEINRGNAASIFGDMFQLLDRLDDGSSRFAVKNPNMEKYLIDNLKDENLREKVKTSLENRGIYIPSNLTIFATMNSSDQNVFTLDTAFKRRWSFELISNDFDDEKRPHPYKDWFVPGTKVTWKDFLVKLNNEILRTGLQNQTNEDKQLGTFFVTKECLLDPEREYNPDEIVNASKEFAYKVLEYIWNDVCKFDREEWFYTEQYNTLERLIKAFIKPAEGYSPLSVFKKIEFGDESHED